MKCSVTSRSPAKRSSSASFVQAVTKRSRIACIRRASSGGTSRAGRAIAAVGSLRRRGLALRIALQVADTRAAVDSRGARAPPRPARVALRATRRSRASRGCARVRALRRAACGRDRRRRCGPGARRLRRCCRRRGASRSRFGSASSAMIRAGRLDVEDVERRAGELRRSRVPPRVRASSTQRSARGVHEHGAGFHPRERAASISPRVAVGDRRMQAHDVARREQRVEGRPIPRPPARRARASTKGSCTSTRAPKPRSRFATPRPTAPSPTRPDRLARSSRPRSCEKACPMRPRSPASTPAARRKAFAAGSLRSSISMYATRDVGDRIGVAARARRAPGRRARCRRRRRRSPRRRDRRRRRAARAASRAPQRRARRPRSRRPRRRRARRPAPGPRAAASPCGSGRARAGRGRAALERRVVEVRGREDARCDGVSRAPPRPPRARAGTRAAAARRSAHPTARAPPRAVARRRRAFVRGGAPGIGRRAVATGTASRAAATRSGKSPAATPAQSAAPSALASGDGPTRSGVERTSASTPSQVSLAASPPETQTALRRRGGHAAPRARGSRAARTRRLRSMHAPRAGAGRDRCARTSGENESDAIGRPIARGSETGAPSVASIPVAPSGEHAASASSRVHGLRGARRRATRRASSSESPIGPALLSTTQCPGTRWHSVQTRAGGIDDGAVADELHGRRGARDDSGRAREGRAAAEQPHCVSAPPTATAMSGGQAERRRRRRRAARRAARRPAGWAAARDPAARSPRRGRLPSDPSAMSSSPDVLACDGSVAKTPVIRQAIQSESASTCVACAAASGRSRASQRRRAASEIGAGQ